MPLRRFSSASASSVHSWSESTPAARYALSRAPGGRARDRRPDDSPGGDAGQHSGSPATTPGKFMTSATPIAAYSSSSVATSAANSSAPGLSKGDAGTQTGADPEGERELASRCDEHHHAGDPEHVGHLVRVGGHRRSSPVAARCGRTRRSTTSSIPRCMWASTRPAVTAAPSRSTSSMAFAGTPTRYHALTDGQIGRHPLPRRRGTGPAPDAEADRPARHHGQRARTCGEDGARAMEHAGPAGLRRQPK